MSIEFTQEQLDAIAPHALYVKAQLAEIETALKKADLGSIGLHVGLLHYHAVVIQRMFGIPDPVATRSGDGSKPPPPPPPPPHP